MDNKEYCCEKMKFAIEDGIVTYLPSASLISGWFFGGEGELQFAYCPFCGEELI